MKLRGTTDEHRRRAARRRATKKAHDKRRAAGVCINNPKHGATYKGGRCVACWDKKKSAEKSDHADSKWKGLVA